MPEVVAFQLQIAVKGADPAVGTARQFAIRFPSTENLIFPATLPVADN